MQQFVYPRLGRSVALSLAEEIRRTAAEDPAALLLMSDVGHPLAAPVPTGGVVASPDQIRRVCDSVRQAAAPFIGDDLKVPSGKINPFDVAVGRALHETLAIVPADAAHEGPWSFLTLVALPDIAYARFSDMPDARLIGAAPRNVLRRAWQRVDVLGEWLWYGEPPLYEDESVQLTERQQLARNHRLARCLAKGIVEHGHSARTECSREVIKAVTWQTGPLLLDVYDDQAIADLVQERIMQGHMRWEEMRARKRRAAAGSAADEVGARGAHSSREIPAWEMSAGTEEGLRGPGVVRDREWVLEDHDGATRQGKGPLTSAELAMTTELEEAPDRVEEKYLRPAGEDLSPAWHPDPWGLARLRWWDGTQWTVHVAQ